MLGPGLLGLAADLRGDHAAARGRATRPRPIALAGMMALIVGAIEIGLGLGKLGFVADLLSKEVQVGYMNGLAVTIIVGQLPKLFGFSTDADGFIEECAAFFAGSRRDRRARRSRRCRDAGRAPARPPRVSQKVPAVLVAVVGATVVSAVLGLADEGVDDGRRAAAGLAGADVPVVSLDDVGPLLVAALGIVLVSLTDTIATSTSFAARRGDEVDPNQEMIGMGAANVFAGLFQGFAISTSGSRTAVAEQSGSKSQVTGLVGAALVALLLLFLTALLQDLPQPALAAVVIAAALSLFNIAVLRTLLAGCAGRRSCSRWSRSLGVILFGVLEGIVIAIVLSVLLFFRRSWWPHGAVLGRVRRARRLARHRRFPDARGGRGVLVYRWEAPLFFANAGSSASRSASSCGAGSPAWVVLQCEAITDIDVTAAEMLDQLDTELNAKGVNVGVRRDAQPDPGLLERYGLFATFTREHVYPSIDMALRENQGGGAASSDRRSSRGLALRRPLARRFLTRMSTLNRNAHTGMTRLAHAERLTPNRSTAPATRAGDDEPAGGDASSALRWWSPKG